MDTSIRQVTTQATLEEKKKLKKEFKLFDMIFVTIAAIIGIDTLGAVSSNGAQALTWLLISAVTFLIPYGLLTSELGSTFTQEGGVYEWVKLAFGRIPASFAAMLYWISNPLWVGGTLANVRSDEPEQGLKRLGVSVSQFFRCAAPFLLRYKLECRITPSPPAQKALTPSRLRASWQAPPAGSGSLQNGGSQ